MLFRSRFLNDSLDDEDEVLLVLTEELGNFVPLVGGPEYAYTLLPPLVSLASVEELLVREKCVQSLKTVLEAMPASQYAEHVVPIFDQLSTGAWFTSRTSIAALYATAYPKLDDKGQKLLRELFAKLATDSTPMVRRAAATALGNFAIVQSKSHSKNEMLPLFEKLAADDQDSVRVLAVDNCIALAPQLGASTVLPVIKACLEDKSWRVRYAAADRFCRLCEVSGTETTKTQLLKGFVALLGDDEAEVRTAAATKVDGVCKLLPVDLAVLHILPCVKTLVGDTSQHVRAALASAIMQIAQIGRASCRERV